LIECWAYDVPFKGRVTIGQPVTLFYAMRVVRQSVNGCVMPVCTVHGKKKVLHLDTLLRRNLLLVGRSCAE
jgi:hypothetical protein